ncbi:cobalamin biosynthesis protein [Bartonella apis]|uniref:cobalamin biosynthesis protein n=1 Tax=Bartonella apis TaxID=1686310 RepID=UPI003BB5D7BB
MVDRSSMPVFVGIGISSSATTGDLEEALELLKKWNVVALSTLDGKQSNGLILSALKRLSVPLLTFSSEELETMTCFLKNPSDIVFQHTGCHGVAEAAALVASGKGGILLVEKTKIGGLTIAVAGQKEE